jgi:hypothetical protein
LHRRAAATATGQEKHGPAPSLLGHKSLADQWLGSELNRHRSAEQ